jgi:Chaperone of endosialidase
MSFGNPLRVARVGAFCIAALLVAGAPNEAAAQLHDVSNGTSYLTGNLGIGTTSPGAALDVQPSGTSTDFQITSSGFSSQVTLTTSQGTSSYIRVIPNLVPDGNNVQSLGAGFNQWASIYGVNGYFSGNVGIGQSSPSYVLDVSGQARFTGGYTTSDRRWKTNIEPLKDSLSVIGQLQGVSFNWRRKEFPKMHFAEGEQLGFIAQEVEKVLPAIVSTDRDGYKNISYESITPVLVEAVKEQQSQITALKAANDNLVTRVSADDDALKAEDDALKAANDNIADLRASFEAYKKAHP